MLSRRLLFVRIPGLVLAVVTMMAAVSLPVHHHADHPDEAPHLEHAHGGHGGLMEQADAHLPGPQGPSLPSSSTMERPWHHMTVVEGVFPDDILAPRGRAPPSHRPRAPPLTS